MNEQFITIKEVTLNNNCPECYNTNGLQLTFKQKYIETRFYKSITQETAHQLECKTCESIIYPVRWTDDIDRVFQYHQRAFVPKKSSLKLKRQAWLLLLLAVIIILTGVVLLIVNPRL